MGWWRPDASRAYISSARQRMYNGDTWRYLLDFRHGLPVPPPFFTVRHVCWPFADTSRPHLDLDWPESAFAPRVLPTSTFSGSGPTVCLKSSRASPARARVQVKSSMNGKRHLPSKAYTLPPLQLGPSFACRRKLGRIGMRHVKTTPLKINCHLSGRCPGVCGAGNSRERRQPPTGSYTSLSSA